MTRELQKPQVELGQSSMKRKGKLSEKSRAIENSAEFKQARHKHAAVESAINGLEPHGLDISRDYGIIGFKKHVALAVVTRNIHRIGELLHRREEKCFTCQHKNTKRVRLKLAA